MAIQIPNPGTGNGASGDNEFVLWTKTKDNFSNTTHAASRLVGIEPEQIPLAKDTPIASRTAVPVQHSATTAQSLDKYVTPSLSYVASNKGNTSYPSTGGFGYGLVETLRCHTNGLKLQKVHTVSGGTFESSFRYTLSNHDDPETVTWSDWAHFYTTKNTTIDSNKMLKTSSPVVRVFSDHLDKIHEANQLPIKYNRNGVGDYTIEGTTGLRENDWQIVIPKDDHDNQLIAFTLEDDNGTIHLKTYKRTFSMQTFTFGPDLEAPMDIPDGRWVDLHFNDLPQDDFQTEV